MVVWIDWNWAMGLGVQEFGWDAHSRKQGSLQNRAGLRRQNRDIHRERERERILKEFCCWWSSSIISWSSCWLQISANILQGQWVNYYNYCSNRDGGRNKRRGSAIGVQQHWVPGAGLVEQGRQCMADDSSDIGRNAIGARAGDPLRQHSEEEMGSQLRVHGILCICSGVDLLGDLGLQDVVRREADSHLGQSWYSMGIQDTASASYFASFCHCRLTHDTTFLPHGDYDLLPIRLRCHHAHPSWRLLARPHELHRLDGVCPLVAHFLVQRRCFQLVGWWISVPVGLYRLFWWLCDPSLFWSCWLHFRVLGRQYTHHPQSPCPPGILPPPWSSLNPKPKTTALPFYFFIYQACRSIFRWRIFSDCTPCLKLDQSSFEVPDVLRRFSEFLCRLDQGWRRIGSASHPTTCCLCWRVRDYCGWDGQGSMEEILMPPTLILPSPSSTPTCVQLWVSWCGQSLTSSSSASRQSSEQCKAWSLALSASHLQLVSLWRKKEKRKKPARAFSVSLMIIPLLAGARV